MDLRTEKKPIISERREILTTPWIRVVEKEVDLGLGKGKESFYSLRGEDYMTVFARTPSGRIPIVRQYRPAVESYTYELPAGHIEKGENPWDTCRRELKEETGLEVLSMEEMGSFYPDTGRLEILQHCFYVKASEPVEPLEVEPGISVEFWTDDQLKEGIQNATFRHQLHISVALLACHLFE